MCSRGMAVALHCRREGAGPPLLCLHGHPGNGAAMAVFSEHFAARFRVLAPDLRGYGRSRVRSPFTMADHLTDLTHLLAQEVPPGQRPLLLGWSLGGILALELALANPETFAGLILIASAARPRGNHPPVTWADQGLTAIASLINRLYPGWPWNIRTFGQRSLYRYLLHHHTPAAYRRLAQEGFPAYFQTSTFAQRALSQALGQGYDRRESLSTLTLPTLILCGQGDRHITAASSQETAALLPHCTLHTFPDAAHLLPWEIPERLLGAIDTWLEVEGLGNPGGNPMGPPGPGSGLG